MALHHHLKHLHTVHRHVRHASHATLAKLAEQHPILTTALTIIGGVSVWKWATTKNTGTQSQPASTTGTVTP